MFENRARGSLRFPGREPRGHDEDEQAHPPRGPKQPSRGRRARGGKNELGAPPRDNAPLGKRVPDQRPKRPTTPKSASEAPGAFRGRASPLRSGAQETTLRDVAVFPRGTWTTPTSPSERRRTWCSRRGRRAFDEESEALTCVPSCLDDVNARPLLIANDNAIALAA